MNSKMIAVLAVAIMAVSGCVVTMSAQSDADAVDLGMVYVDTNPAEVELRFNEYAYSQYDSYYMVLKAQVGSYADTVVFEAEKPTNNMTNTAHVLVSDTTDLDLTVTKDSMGVYTVQVKNDADKKAASGEYTISFTLYVNAIIGGTATPLTPIGFNLDVNVRSFIVIDGSETVDESMIAGASGSIEVSASIDGDKEVTGFTSWYATGLPDGLNVGIIDGKLMIYGMTAASESDIPCTVNLIGRDAVGNEVRIKNVTFTITKTPKITYEIANVEKVAGVADAYMVESGKTPAPTLTIKVDGVEYSSETNGRQLIVSVISDGGERTDNQYTSGMTIPTNGVGKYVIEMTIGGSSVDGSEVNGVSTTAILYVVPNITGAGAGFIVVGQP